MKIKQKLLFCFLALSLLTLAVTYFTDVANHQETIESFQKVAGESLPGNIALARMTTELYYTLELVSRFSEEQNHGYEKKIGKALATLSTFKTMYFLYLPEEGEWHEKIDETIQRFSSYITEYILLMKRGGTEEELKKVTGKINEILDEFISSVNPHIEDEFSASMQKLETTKKRGLEAKKILIVSSLVILVITLFVSLFISHLLAKPIRILRDAALDIGEGKLDVNIRPTSNDEIGELACAFNEMTANLSLARGEIVSSRDYIDNIVRSIMDALIVTSPAGIIERVNSATCLLLGYREQELIGRPVHHFIVTEKSEELFREKELADLVGNGFVKHLDAFLRTKDGRNTPVSISGSIMSDRKGNIQAGILVARDIRELSNLLDELSRTNKKLKAKIAEHMLTEKALKESEENYREIFNATNEAIFIHDSATGVILDVNQTMLDMYGGYTYDEALNLAISDLSSNEPPYTQEKAVGFVKDAVAHGSQTFEWRARRKNGELFWGEVALKSTEIGGHGRVLAVVRDISYRKEIEGELRQAQKMDAIGTLAGGIAHDFNNILMAIFGNIGLAKMKVDEPDQIHEHLERIELAATRAKDLVAQILTFSRKTEQDKHPLRVDVVLKETMKLLRSSIPTTIEIRADINSQATVLADPTQLHQIIMNLCTNAYHAMRESGGTLGVSLKEFKFTSDDLAIGLEVSPGRYLQLEVSDTGCGMDKATKDRIFEPYFTTKEPGGGVGLGLAVVHGIIKDHNGYITVYSEPGQGTTFHVYLPINEADDETEEPATDTESLIGGSEHLMFIDDEDSIVALVKEVLTKYGYQVDIFTNGVQALQEFKRQPNKYDLVITDMTMPSMTGAELAQRIIEIQPDIPVILCTGFSEMINREKSMAIGIAEYIMKPITMSMLLKSVRQTLDSREKLVS